MKQCIYGVVVALFILAGALDFHSGHTKEGVVAMLFAAANGVIFLWR